MSEKSRDEKLAAAKKKLKKFQESSCKIKSKEELSTNINNKKIPCVSESLDNLQKEKISHNKSDIEEKPQYQASSNAFNSAIEDPTAATETIKHISRHLNGIISCSSSSIDRESQHENLSTIRELEKRNVELASLNSIKAEQIDILNTRIVNLNDNIERITKEYQSEKTCVENSFKKQLDSNKSQLQSQIHTISLLVAEKSELQSQVTYNQKLASQRFQEIEDLTNKLRTSRQKFGDLEKSLNEMKLLNEKYNESKHDVQRQSEQIRFEFRKVKSEKDDLLIENSQLKSKLISKSQEISNLELTLDDIKSQLEMSQVQIQHLTNNEEGHYDNLYSQLKSTEMRNNNLTIELESLKSILQQAESTNNRLQNQYRSYVEQMEENWKLSQMEMVSLAETNNSLAIQLEKSKENVNISSQNCDTQYYENLISELENTKSRLLSQTEFLESEHLTLKEKYVLLSNDKEEFASIIEELEEKNKDLQEKMKQFEINRNNFDQLRNEMQSDKTALSRALAQNKQLKSQLLELQEAFVKLSSDNMDYSTQLQHEKHISKELALRLGEQEEELSDIRLMISSKNEEISKLNHINQQISEELLTFNNENQSVPRSEAHFNMANKVLIENLQTDLLNSQERINRLTTENNNLISELNQNCAESINRNKSETSSETNDELLLALRQIKAERDQLFTKYVNPNLDENNLQANLNQEKILANDNCVVISTEEYQSLKDFNNKAIEELQSLSMKNTLLIKENGHLEHIVEQLEGETDTIAEYIHLYQHQRSMLKHKCRIRDQLMSKLMHKKQLLDNKLNELENLSKSLIQIELKEQKNVVNNESKCQSDNYETDLRSSIYDTMLKTVEDLRQWSNMEQSGSDSVSQNRSENINPCTADGDFAFSDDLLHYQIIHCKCCVGKIIDL